MGPGDGIQILKDLPMVSNCESTSTSDSNLYTGKTNIVTSDSNTDWSQIVIHLQSNAK